MSVINDVLLAVIGMVTLDLYAPIKIGSLPADNGLSIYIGTGDPSETFHTKGMRYELDLVLNGKHSDAKVVSDALNDIHQSLTQTKVYPKTNDYQITNIETIISPNYRDREDNGQILYGSGLRVHFYYKKG